jgi:hypothetical protein
MKKAKKIPAKKVAKKAAKKVVKKRAPVVDEHGLNVRERKFADLYLTGMAAGRAYEAAGFTARGASADTQASLALRNPKVSRYIQDERRRAAEASRMERWELVGYLCRVLRTPVGRVDEDSDLAQEVAREEVADEVVRSRIKMVPKLEAAKQLAQILGYNEPEKMTVKYEVVIGGNAQD